MTLAEGDLRKLCARPRQLSSYEFRNLPRMASNGEFLPRSAACLAIQMDPGCLELHGNHGGLAVGIQHRRGVSGAGGDCPEQIAPAMDRRRDRKLANENSKARNREQ